VAPTSALEIWIVFILMSTHGLLRYLAIFLSL